MGTTLTGTTPATTYDSLIKVTDNGPLSGTAKYLSDGLGNDSTLALSTSAVGIGTTDPQTILNDFSTSARGLAISNSYPFLGFSDTDGGKFFIGTQANIGYIWNNGTSDIIVATNAAEQMRITSTGNVGIGTSSPATTLAVNGITSVLGGQELRVYRTDNATYGSIQYLTGVGGFKFDDVNADGYRFAQGANTAMAISSAGNVGIGTSSPAAKLHVESAGDGTIRIGGTAGLEIIHNNAGNTIAEIKQLYAASSASAQLKLTSGYTTFNVGTSATEIARFTTDGLTFNGDTAAANALDDYEEGTFNFDITFGGSDTGVTYLNRLGNYTKIGRQVTCQGWIRLANKGTATGNAAIKGLPFTIGTGAQFYNGGSIGYIGGISFADQISCYALQGDNGYELVESTNAGVLSPITDADFTSNAEIMVSFTYFV